MDEKKVKLEDLLNEKDLPIEDPKPVPKNSKKKSNLSPSHVAFKEAQDASEKLRILEDSWYFDKPVFLWGWLYASAIITLISLIPVQKEMEQGMYNEDHAYLAEFLLIPTIVRLFSKYSLLLLFFVPVFFKFRKESPFYIKINLQGVETVRKVSLAAESEKSFNRITIKWQDIHDAKLVTRKDRKVIMLTLNDGLYAELIWDFSLIKRKVFAKVLSGLVDKKHPLRVVVEKDLL